MVVLEVGPYHRRVSSKTRNIHERRQRSVAQPQLKTAVNCVSLVMDTFL